MKRLSIIVVTVMFAIILSSYSFALAAGVDDNRGCPREERGPFMKLAQDRLGEEVALVTHCILKPRGPALGVSWNEEDRRRYGVAYRWRKLVKNGVPVNVSTKTAYRFSDMKVKRGELVRFLSAPSGNYFEVKAVANGVIEIPSHLIISDVGRTVIAFPRRIVTTESVMKWQTEGVSICYPSQGDDNYTRGSYNGRASELYRTIAQPGNKNFTVNFSVTC